MKGYLFLIVIVLGWVYCLAKKNRENAISFLLIMSTIYYGSFTATNIDVVLKTLFVMTFFIFIILYGANKRTVLMLIPLIIYTVINILFAKFDSTYSLSDSIMAYISLFSGFIVQLILFTEKQKNKIIETLTMLPLYSLGFGIVLWPLGLVDFLGRYDRSAIAGASLSTNLSFFGIVAIAASLYYFRKTNNIKYRYRAYSNFAIVCSTLTRGGILVGLILICVDILPFVLKICKKAKTFILMVVVILVGMYPLSYVIGQLMARTEANGDSGRILAWTYIMQLCQNKYFGNGYGFLKTREDSKLTFFTAAHNEYVHFYVEIGIIGIIVITIIFAYLFRRILRNKKYIMTKVTIILSFIVLSFFDNTITNFRFWVPFMTLLVCMQTLKGSQTNEFTAKKQE